jgi:hypothetical protein
MRTRLFSGRIAVACASAVAVAAWMLPGLKARVAAPAPAGMAGGAASGVEDDSVPRIYYKAPFTTEEAATWARLQKKAPMNFAQETPFEDFLKYLHAAAANKDDADGLMIYVNPVGLQEAEKTMASPITLNLANVRLEKALRLVLDQLDLAFRVDADGLLMIDFKSSKNADRDDVNAMILDKLDAIEKQIARLRPFGGGMGGGMGGATPVPGPARK